MIAGTCISLGRFRFIGKYNRKVKWPLTYKLKLMIQILNLLISLTQLVLSMVHTIEYPFRYLQLAEQICVWILSLVMFRFEYERALAHAWFMLPTLWCFTTVYYGAEFYLQYIHARSSNKLSFYVLLLSQIVFTMVISALSLFYREDSPHRQFGRYQSLNLESHLLEQKIETRIQAPSGSLSFDFAKAVENDYPAVPAEFPRISVRLTDTYSVSQKSGKVKFEIQSSCSYLDSRIFSVKRTLE